MSTSSIAMQLQAFFFDVDGTLVDSNEYHVEAWRRAFEERGYFLPLADIRKQIGKGGDQLVPALTPHLGAEVRQQIVDTHGVLFETQFLREVKAFPNAAECLETLRQFGARVLLTSSAKAEELEHYVKLLGVANTINGAVSGDDVERSKPAADIFALALQKVAPIPASACVAVGDTPYDARSALKAGIRTIGVRTGPFADAELREAGAFAIYDNVGALLARLRISAGSTQIADLAD